MKAILSAVILAIGAATLASAQTLPFDMSRERPQTSAPTVPQAVLPAPAQNTPVPSTAAATTANSSFQRYVVPFAKFRLEGEYDRKSWSIYLTPEQAAAAAKFNFAYQNAVVVAPEASQLTIFLNNRPIGQQQIGSSDNPSTVSFDVPRGLLQPGANLVSFEATQRHRTDCNIQSTYELWSDIDPAGTYLSFTEENSQKLSGTDAIGVDGAGKTEFNLVVPALAQPGTTKPLLRLAQGLSVLSGMPNETFSFSTDSLPPPGPGKMTVVVGTPAELQPLFPTPAAAQNAALATFVRDPRTGSTVLLISGPSWQSVAAAIDIVVSPTDRDPGIRRDLLVTQRWSAPDAPLILSDTNLSFSQLGIETTEFSGRRFHTSFNVAIPADFYANAYGEATIYLDAAYAKNVRPGSHIDVYVNGSIATTKPITSPGGGIFRKLPIRVTMRHFKPGLNTVTLEAMLLTNDDDVCTPGTTADKTARFALFDTSTFQIPDFARVAQRPNLAAFAGTGYPYGRSSTSTALFIDRTDTDTLSATATLLGQMAIVAGHPIAVDLIASPGSAGDRNAIFIGPISQIPVTTLSQMNIAAASQASWRPPLPGQVAQQESAATVDEWRSRIGGGLLQLQLQSFQDWMHRNFDISWSSLQFIPGAEQIFTPSNLNSFMIAQGEGATANSTWTIVAAPSAKDLRAGANAITSLGEWSQIAGHVTVYSAKTGKIDTVPVSRFDFVTTQPWSFTNYRLIAANWLSSNILSYALLLIASSLLIGITTAGILAKIGRRG
ncbi:cellulose biosynthesis cyclic di-GMP-binding regulatory protein BcsB [Agrobacterium rhizogenes]|nr:cellulose biosynthesis cyclic di-GMP-binding regulatory protein BcsB [Rhizobium rhizogenes]NTG56296.1 cellulose biosynthesis cyclic di-GMP-binding regulatory protein BcsB [Rhizobium rhizogenes]